MSLLQNFIPSLGRNQPGRENSNGTDLGATVKPIYTVKETADAYALTVYLPGVAKDGLELTAEDSEFRLVARRASQQPEGWTVLYRESDTVPYELVLSHDNALNAEKIAAELRDGVLHVTLPKSEALKPRKIAIS
jgi:HSP20 family protein